MFILLWCLVVMYLVGANELDWAAFSQLWVPTTIRKLHDQCHQSEVFMHHETEIVGCTTQCVQMLKVRLMHLLWQVHFFPCIASATQLKEQFMSRGCAKL